MIDDDHIRFYVRPWIGLSNEEVSQAVQICERGNYLVAFRRIHQTLKKKNHITKMIAHHQKIRAMLTDTDGFTAREIMLALNVDKRVLARSLKSMPDVYIDRWIGPKRGQWCAVWCVAAVPTDCPKPE